MTSNSRSTRGTSKSWCANAGFWTGIADYVRFWAQETYADARAWGVADATLAQRSAYLNDYFVHGIRLAQHEDGSTAAARAFVTKAYTPVGNASFRYPAPNTATGIGFGYTDIALTGMLNFVSTRQADACVGGAPGDEPGGDVKHGEVGPGGWARVRQRRPSCASVAAATEIDGRLRERRYV